MSHDAPTFFVDYELIATDAAPPRVCFAFRIGEQRIGDERAEVDARSALTGLRAILRHAADRRDDALFALPLEALFPRLEVGVLVYADPGVDAGSDWKRFLRFLALPHECLTFRGWSAFLLEDDERARFVWCEPERGSLCEAWLRPGEVEAALRAFSQDLESGLDARHSVSPRSGERLRAGAALAEGPASRRAGER